MDIISHALWTNLVFQGQSAETRAWMAFFSVLPDLVSFTGIAWKRMTMRLLHYRAPSLKSMPAYVFHLYDFTHSLLIWLAVYLILRMLAFDLAAFIYVGWGFHILLDVFTHRSDYFPTPILFPVSKFKFSGIRWSNKWFMLFNYSVLFFLYLFFY
jgi:hypothetical protein